MTEKVFKTKDLYFASALYAEQLTLLDIQTVNGVCWFGFENPQMCQSKYAEYISRKLLVNAKAFEEAIKTLKGLVFSSERR